PDLAFALFQYLQDLRTYSNAQEAYGASASAYWNSIADKRKGRISKRVKGEKITIDDYVSAQPPVYAGPPRPINPSLPKEQIGPAPLPTVPVVADFLAAAEQQFGFVPHKPASEIEFKRAYAKVATAAGLTKDQVVRIYGFEATGDGTYDVQAGL